MAGDEVEQREIYYSGRVQGVGFRYTARSIAGQYEVTGFVRNMPDGRVQLVLEGSREEIQAYIQELQAEMGSYVQNTQVSARPASGRFRIFEVRF
jgi:acylphosphatase